MQWQWRLQSRYSNPGISKSQIMNALTSYTPNSLQAEARFLTLPSIDFTTLTSILLIKAAFFLGNIYFSLFLFSLPITITQGLFLKDYLFEEPLEVYAVPIGPSYTKSNAYAAPESQSYISSKSDSFTSFDNLGSPTYPVIPKRSLSRSSSKLRVSPTYRHIPLRTERPVVKNLKEEKNSNFFQMKEKQQSSSLIPPLENSHPHASFLPAPDSMQMQEKASVSTGSADEWIPGGLLDFPDYTNSDYILDYLEKTFYQLPDYTDVFSELREELSTQRWQKVPSSNISPRSSDRLQIQKSQPTEHSTPISLLAPSRLVVSEPDLGSNSYDRRLIVEVPSDQPPGDPLANLVCLNFL